GDTGSLAIGGAISYFALMSNTTLLIPIIGGCFLISAVSVILQVLSYKLRNGKRIFKMAPLHHHFELSGMHETKVVLMYSVATFVLCIIGLIAFIAA
ncbi:MAG: phospho-N-acetylmuramoyl-pentapeptide-transferase, partial [Clostridia bacterium]|nr:phospho-N-acetylmuramoyl-pentapeptide-transferase [Clostridia bacterium]